jgi:CheY-like chemotaxis protein
MERRAHPRPQRVLLADDSADLREMWRTWLTIWGFAVAEADNGAQAMEMALRCGPQLILMDLWMPVVDGLEAMKRLKADARTARIPILALSAQDVLPSPSTARLAGADAFVLKPLQPEQLLDAIRTTMRHAPT